MKVRELLLKILQSRGASETTQYRKLHQYDKGLPIVLRAPNGDSYVFQYGYGIRKVVEQPLTEELAKELAEEMGQI